MAFAYTIQERADLNAKASALLKLTLTSARSSAKGFAAILIPKHWSICAPRSIRRL